MLNVRLCGHSEVCFIKHVFIYMNENLSLFCSVMKNNDYSHTNTKFIKTTKKFFTFDVSTSIRGLHQKKLVLGLLLPVLGAIN